MSKVPQVLLARKDQRDLWVLQVYLVFVVTLVLRVRRDIQVCLV